MAAETAVATTPETKEVKIYTPCEKPNFSGFYVGLQGGSNVSKTTKVFNDSSKVTENTGGYFGGLFTGYGNSFGKYCVGAELFFNLNTPIYESKDSGSGYSSTYKILSKNNFGSKLRLGYVLCDKYMPYIGLNIETTKLVKSYYNSYSLGEQRGVASKRLTSCGPVLGCELAFNRNIFMRTEYNCLINQTVSLVDKNDGSSVKLKLNQHRLSLGVGYRF